jgi:hypothetical protein
MAGQPKLAIGRLPLSCGADLIPPVLMSVAMRKSPLVARSRSPFLAS